MRYSILTPTILRPTLKRLCDSIDSQSCKDYEHVVIVDCVPDAEGQALLKEIEHPNRVILMNPNAPHPCDFGNNARRYGFGYAQGDYILQLDDDDYYADSEVFETLKCVTRIWAIFPVLAYGRRCHRKDPGRHKTGSAMFMYRRDTGLKFEDSTEYSADGNLVEELKKRYVWQSLDDIRELVIYEKANRGRTQEQIEAWERIHKPLKYAADGLTVDWNDQFRRG